VAQNTTLVVDHVAVAAVGSFDLFDDSGLKEVGQPPPDLPGLSLPEEAEAFLDRPRSLNLFVGSQTSKDRQSRFHCFADRCSAPVSRRRRLTRRPRRSRVTRCRISVTMLFARAIRCYLSTAAAGRGVITFEVTTLDRTGRIGTKTVTHRCPSTTRSGSRRRRLVKWEASSSVPRALVP